MTVNVREPALPMALLYYKGTVALFDVEEINVQVPVRSAHHTTCSHRVMAAMPNGFFGGNVKHRMQRMPG